MSKKKPAAVKSKTTVSKRKKSAAVPPPQGRGAAKPKATRAPGRAVSLLPQVRAIVDGPNSPKGAVDELRNFLIANHGNKQLKAVADLVHDAHTDGETLHNLRDYLKTKNA